MEAVTQLLASLGGNTAGAVKPPQPAKARSKPAAPPVKPPTLDEFIAGLPARSRRFLELVRERGIATASEIVAELDLSSTKAVGGITGAIGRWGPRRGVTLPYEALNLNGERAWRWIAADGPSKSDALIAALGKTHAARFMRHLKESGRLTMGEVLEDLGLSRAQGLRPVLESIRLKASAVGIDEPFETTTSQLGDRVFLWPGVPEEESTESASEPAKKSKSKVETAGVGVRRRRKGA